MFFTFLGLILAFLNNKVYYIEYIIRKGVSAPTRAFGLGRTIPSLYSVD